MHLLMYFGAVHIKRKCFKRVLYHGFCSFSLLGTCLEGVKKMFHFGEIVLT